MKAVLKLSLAPGAKIRDVEVPVIGLGEVMLKVKVAAICGSGVHIYHSSPP